MEEVRDFMVRSLKKGKNEGSLIGRFLKLTLIRFCDKASLTKCQFLMDIHTTYFQCRHTGTKKLVSQMSQARTGCPLLLHEAVS